MAIQFPVGRGTILLCDYSMGGFRPPEMIKRRPAVVLSPRLAFRDGLCSVVPLSGSPPARLVDYVVRLATGKTSARPVRTGRVVGEMRYDRDREL